MPIDRVLGVNVLRLFSVVARPCALIGCFRSMYTTTASFMASSLSARDADGPRTGVDERFPSRLHDRSGRDL